MSFSSPGASPSEKQSEAAFTLRSLAQSSAKAQTDYIKLINQLKVNLIKAGIGYDAFPTCPFSRRPGIMADLLKGSTVPETKTNKSPRSPEKQITSMGSHSSRIKEPNDWDDIWGDNEENKETYNSPDLFFGKEAKDKFRSMFK